MEIKDIEVGNNYEELVVTVIEKSNIKEFQTQNGTGKVVTCIVEDSSGSIELSLFGKHAEEVNVGDNITLHKVFCKEWNNKKQIVLSRFGFLVVNKLIPTPQITAKDPEMVEDKPTEKRKRGRPKKVN